MPTPNTGMKELTEKNEKIYSLFSQHCYKLFLVYLLLLTFLAPVLAGPAFATWSTLGSGMNDRVYALAYDAATNSLYAGGWFTTAGGTTANRIAKWDTATSTWSPLGSGMNSSVFAIAYDAATNSLYSGGGFTFIGGNYIAKWNAATSTWSPLGSSMNNAVLSLAYGKKNGDRHQFCNTHHKCYRHTAPTGLFSFPRFGDFGLIASPPRRGNACRQLLCYYACLPTAPPRVPTPVKKRDHAGNSEAWERE